LSRHCGREGAARGQAAQKVELAEAQGSHPYLPILDRSEQTTTKRGRTRRASIREAYRSIPRIHDCRRKIMAEMTYDPQRTALLVIDPYNDFISEGGKVWDRIKGVADANNCVPNMLQVLNAARSSGLRVFYALHHRYRPGDYETWKYIAPIQKGAWSRKTFEYGTWGGEIRREFEPKPGEIVAAEHWCSSGFANTDLDLQLKKHGIHQLIVVGLIAHTCVEATVRFAAELGYDVTVVKDATADYSDEEMHAALDINIPNYASAVVSTQEVTASISALQCKRGNVKVA
jgi:ureidoacrylate peracid hydrolase